VSDVPDELRKQVIAEVYRRADELDWDGLSQVQRSTWYDRWLDEVHIGGVLTRFMSRERARRWLKDVPMKHYARARSGIGPYASLATRRLPDAGDVARAAFGGTWCVVGSVSDKPNRCVIASEGHQLLMVWGPPTNFKALLWAAMNALVDQRPRPVIVVATPHQYRLRDDEQRRHLALGKCAAIEVRHSKLPEHAGDCGGCAHA
jgi:hypothetical protein